MCWPLRPGRDLVRHLPSLGMSSYLCRQAIRQSRDHQRGIDHELSVLLIHGVLHLVAMTTNRATAEARRMARRERAVLRDIGPFLKLLVSRESDPV